MKMILTRPFVLLLAVLLLSPAIGLAEEKKTLETEKERLSYGIGLDLGRDMANQSLDLDQKALIQGLKDGLGGGAALLSDEEVEAVKQAFVEKMRAKREAEMQAQAEENQAKGQAFLKENAEKEGVETLSSGLQYQVIEPGTGEKPSAEDQVKVHYRGTLIDGTEFDSSYKRGTPAVFPLNGVIPGWTEALQLMKVGGKWKLYIPSDLAYGERGAGGVIGPNETLVFEVELLEIL